MYKSEPLATYPGSETLMKPSDYQKWVDETGDERWGWHSLMSSYKKLENNQRLSGNFHGSDGSIKVSDPGYVAKGSDLYIKSMQNLGLPYNRDFNDGDQYGVGLMQYTIGDGRRSDTVSTLIKPLSEDKNLQIKLNAVVTCLLYTSPSPRDATLSRMPSSA